VLPRAEKCVFNHLIAVCQNFPLIFMEKKDIEHIIILQPLELNHPWQQLSLLDL
jgi:hypothetical protein